MPSVAERVVVYWSLINNSDGPCPYLMARRESLLVVVFVFLLQNFWEGGGALHDISSVY